MPKGSDKFKHASNVTWRQVDKDAVILDLDTSNYFSLNEVGVLVWERLGDGATIAEVCEEVCKLYDVPPKDALRDIEKLVAALSAKKLLVKA